MFTPSALIPVLNVPIGCSKNLVSNVFTCDLTGMPSNTSRTFVFAGTAVYQQYASSEVRAEITSSGNDLGTHPQEGAQIVYVDRDQNQVHSLDISFDGINPDYFLNDPFSFTTTVENRGPSNAPARVLKIHHYGFSMTPPAGCSIGDYGYNIVCPIPALTVGETFVKTWTGVLNQPTYAGMDATLDFHPLETFNYNVSPSVSFRVRGQVGLLSTAFTPSPPASFDNANPQSFTAVVTNNAPFSSLPGQLGILFKRPDNLPLAGFTTGGLEACALTNGSDYTRRFECSIPVIAPGASWSFSFTANDPQAGRFSLEAVPTGPNDTSGQIAYHEINSTNGLPLTLAWKPGNTLPNSPPGFVFGQSHPFAVDITNPNTTSKSFTLEVRVTRGYAEDFDFTLGRPIGCSIAYYENNPDFNEDGRATCSVILAAGQTSSLFFSANFPNCDPNSETAVNNCTSSVRITDVKARLIGANATPLTKRVLINP
jgi:hypothetical protein